MNKSINLMSLTGEWFPGFSGGRGREVMDRADVWLSFQNREMEFLYLLVAAMFQYLDYGKSKNSYMIRRIIQAKPQMIPTSQH